MTPSSLIHQVKKVHSPVMGVMSRSASRGHTKITPLSHSGYRDVNKVDDISNGDGPLVTLGAGFHFEDIAHLMRTQTEEGTIRQTKETK